MEKPPPVMWRTPGPRPINEQWNYAGQAMPRLTLYWNTGVFYRDHSIGGARNRPRTIAQLRYLIEHHPDDLGFDHWFIPATFSKWGDPVTIRDLIRRPTCRCVVTGPDPHYQPYWFCYVGWRINKVELWTTRQTFPREK